LGNFHYLPQKRPFIWERKAWGASDPTGYLYPLGTVEQITIHHTVSAAKPPFEEVKSVQRYHMQKEPDPFFDIGYHFLVDRAASIDGRDIYEGRQRQSNGVLSQGAHVAGRNQGNIGVAVLGNYEDEPFSEGQRRVLVDLLAWLCYLYSVPFSEIRAHRDFSPTSCPGRHLYTELDGIRQELVDRLVAREGPPDRTVNIVVNGQPLNLEPQAVLVNGTAVAPVRPLAEAQGAHVRWNASTRTVYLDSNGK